ncbi:CAAX amino terminal protease self- immunity [Streptomyces sp. MP131-18]|nr:CAAX amino terminal protease self- immunity [Streptomyces sp. MP131-18]
MSYSWYTLRAVPAVRRHVFELSRLKLIGIWAAVVSGVVEEIVLRQLLVDGLSAAGAARAVQVLTSAAVSGAAHALWVLIRGAWRVALPVVASTAALGALLAILHLVADRNVLPAIAAHVAINLVIEPWLILAAVSSALITHAGDTARSHSAGCLNERRG